MMNKKSLLLAAWLLAQLSNADVYRYASTGGGIRSMVANMGLANVLEKAGVFDSEALSAMSTSSGSTWFSTQLFYSEPFYENTMGSPEVLRDFVVTWMDAYYNMTAGLETESPYCNINQTVALSMLQNIEEYCQIFAAFDGNWADYVQQMLLAASTAYGDEGFVDRIAGTRNRLSPVSNVNLMIQFSVAASSRVRLNETLVYLGPSTDEAEIYSVPIPAQYVVAGDRISHVYAIDALLNTSVGGADAEFVLDDYEDFSLFPGVDGSVFIDNPSNELVGELQKPFGGSAAKTSQVCGASSAALASMSGLVPSTFAQSVSYTLAGFQLSNLTEEQLTSTTDIYLAFMNRIYESPLFDNMAVCSQYPEPCNSSDARLMDGWFSDDPTLALNLGHYQNTPGADPSETIKVVLFNTAEDSNVAYKNSIILQYFSSIENQGVEPGAYIWPTAFQSPKMSTQLFEDELSAEVLEILAEPLPNTNMTVTMLNATTIDNPTFGISAGQRVEIMLLTLNSPITTSIIGTTKIAETTPALADLAYGIATDQELLSRVANFFGTTPAPTEFPTEAPVEVPTLAPAVVSTPTAPAGTDDSSAVLRQLSWLVIAGALLL